MSRNPNGPIPGFEDEYTGTVGKEKAVHHWHFTMPAVSLRKTRYNSGYEWIQKGQKWYLIKKESEQ